MNESQHPSPAPPDQGPCGDIEQLAQQLQALPPLPAPPGMWQRVQRRAAERRESRRIGRRRRRTVLALAASLLAALGTVLLVGQGEEDPARTPAPPASSAGVPHPQPGASDLDWPQLPLAASAEHLVLARISSIDADLNRQLLQGNGARPALLRQRATLADGLAHIQRHRQQLLLRQAVY